MAEERVYIVEEPWYMVDEHGYGPKDHRNMQEDYENMMWSILLSGSPSPILALLLDQFLTCELLVRAECVRCP